MNLVQVQEHLKGMPTQVLMGYANGQNPQVPPYIALGELNRRKQMEQQPAQAPQGSVKDQIEQSLTQPQQLPGLAAQGVPVPQAPQPQGIPSQMPQQLAGAAPQQAPTKMAAGGLASVPMRKDMFNYAPGGIVAFANEENDQVVKDEEAKSELDLAKEIVARNAEKLEAGQASKGDDKGIAGLKYDTERNLPSRAHPGKKAAGDDFMEGVAATAKDAASGIGDYLSRLVNPDAEILAKRRTSQMAVPIEEPRMQGTQASYTRQQRDASTDPRVQAALALMNPSSGGVADLVPTANKLVAGLTEDQAVQKAKQRNQQEGIAYTQDDEKALRRRHQGAEPDVAAPQSAAPRPAPQRAGVPGAPAVTAGGNPNDPLSFLRAQLSGPEPTYKSRADYIAEAAKTNPELLVKPEEGLRGLLEKLSQSQLDARERAMRGEKGQQMSDISNALIAAGEATRGQKGRGIGSAFGGFGKTFNASSAAATERQAQRDALQQKQDLDMAKLQYEYSEKARARAMGDVDAEMRHDKNIADLKNQRRDDQIKAANYLAVDARTRDANASAAELRREQIQALREGKPSPEDKITTIIMDKANRNPLVSAIAAQVKAGTIVPGTPEFTAAVRQVEAITAPYYLEMKRTPPPPAQIFEDMIKQKEPTWWAKNAPEFLGGSPSTPAPSPNVVDFSKLPK